MRVILISGKARHGKDTVAKFIQERIINKGHTCLIAHYGDLLKYICTKFFGWNGKKDDYGRWLLQHVGTDIIRAKEENFWVDFLCDVITIIDKWDYVIIPDCRFPNEIQCVIDRGLNTTHIRIIRTNFESNLTEEQKNHPSETALDDVIPDYYIYNNGSMNELKDKSYEITDTILHA